MSCIIVCRFLLLLFRLSTFISFWNQVNDGVSGSIWHFVRGSEFRIGDEPRRSQMIEAERDIPLNIGYYVWCCGTWYLRRDIKRFRPVIHDVGLHWLAFNCGKIWSLKMGWLSIYLTHAKIPDFRRSKFKLKQGSKKETRQVQLTKYFNFLTRRSFWLCSDLQESLSNISFYSPHLYITANARMQR